MFLYPRNSFMLMVQSQTQLGPDWHIDLPVLLADIGLWQIYQYLHTSSVIRTNIKTVYYSGETMLGLVISNSVITYFVHQGVIWLFNN